MRVILDTNVLLSALIRVDSKPYKLLIAWFDGRYDLVSSQMQIEELTKVSRYPHVRRYLLPSEIGSLVNRIRERAIFVARMPTVDVSKDPGDNFLLAMAQASGSDYLVTGDIADLLVLKRHRKTHIVSVAEMVAQLRLR